MQNTPPDQSAQVRKPVIQTRRAKARRAKVATMLGGELTYREIGALLGVSGEVIRNDVMFLGLIKQPPGSTRGVPVPSKPKGYPKATLEWAEANKHRDPEARMICAMVAG